MESVLQIKIVQKNFVQDLYLQYATVSFLVILSQQLQDTCSRNTQYFCIITLCAPVKKL